jgi:hypothetical protein
MLPNQCVTIQAYTNNAVTEHVSIQRTKFASLQFYISIQIQSLSILI